MNRRDQLGEQIAQQHLDKGLKVVAEISDKSKDKKKKGIFDSILSYFSHETEDEKQERMARELKEKEERDARLREEMKKKAEEERKRLERMAMEEAERTKHEADDAACNTFESSLKEGVKQEKLEKALEDVEKSLHFKKCSNNLQEQILNLIKKQDEEQCNRIANSLTDNSKVFEDATEEETVQKTLENVEQNLLGKSGTCANHDAITSEIDRIKQLQEKKAQEEKDKQEQEAKNQLKEVCDEIKDNILSKNIESLEKIQKTPLNKLTKDDIGISGSKEKVCGHDINIMGQANRKKACMIEETVSSDSCGIDFQTLVNNNKTRENILEKLKKVINDKNYDEYENLKNEYINTSPEENTVNKTQHNEIIDHLIALRVKKWDHFCSTIREKIDAVTLNTWAEFATIQNEYKAEEESMKLDQSETFGTQTQYLVFTSHNLQYDPLDIVSLIEEKQNDIKKREIENILHLTTSIDMRTSYDNFKYITSIDSIDQVDQQLKKLEQEEQNENEIEQIKASVESSSVQDLVTKIEALGTHANLKDTQRDNINKLKEEVKEKFKKETEQMFKNLKGEIQKDTVTEDNVDAIRQNVQLVAEENKKLRELQENIINANAMLNGLNSFVNDQYNAIDDIITGVNTDLQNFDQKVMECKQNLSQIQQAYDNRNENTLSTDLENMIQCNDIASIRKEIDAIVQQREDEEKLCKEKLKEFMKGFSESELKQYMDNEGKLCPIKTLEQLNEMQYQRDVQISILTQTIQNLTPIVKNFKHLKEQNDSTLDKTNKYLAEINTLISENVQTIQGQIQKFAVVKKHQEDVLKKHDLIDEHFIKANTQVGRENTKVELTDVSGKTKKIEDWAKEPKNTKFSILNHTTEKIGAGGESHVYKSLDDESIVFKVLKDPLRPTNKPQIIKDSRPCNIVDCEYGEYSNPWKEIYANYVISNEKDLDGKYCRLYNWELIEREDKNIDFIMCLERYDMDALGYIHLLIEKNVSNQHFTKNIQKIVHDILNIWALMKEKIDFIIGDPKLENILVNINDDLNVTKVVASDFGQVSIRGMVSIEKDKSGTQFLNWLKGTLENIIPKDQEEQYKYVYYYKILQYYFQIVKSSEESYNIKDLIAALNKNTNDGMNFFNYKSQE